MLGYPNQQRIVLIGTKSGTTRTGTATGSTYVTNRMKEFATGGASKLNFDILYDVGAAETNNNINLKIESSPDGTNWYQIVNESVSGGTSTLTQREFTFVGASATTYAFSLPLDVQDEYMRVWASETNVAANYGTVYVEVTISGI